MYTLNYNANIGLTIGYRLLLVASNIGYRYMPKIHRCFSPVDIILSGVIIVNHCMELSTHTYCKLQYSVLFHQLGFIPPISIDSFRHMYMFPGTIEDIQ